MLHLNSPDLLYLSHDPIKLNQRLDLTAKGSQFF
jgi:hypothetical protein